MTDKFLILLLGIAKSPTAKFFGERGKTYIFRWSEQYKAMLFEGRELTAAEFDEVAGDVFAANYEQNTGRPVPKRLPGSAIGAGGDQAGGYVPRFDHHAQLLKVCENLGKAELLNAELNRILAGKGIKAPTEPSKPKAAAPSPTIAEPAEKGAMVDFDPEDAPTAAPVVPRGAPAVPVIRPVPAVIPSKPIPTSVIKEGDFDCDDLEGLTVSQAIQ